MKRAGAPAALDLNADAGERAVSPEEEARLFAAVTSVNIACGWHAGDPAAMEDAVRAALARGLRIGAHPGYADRAGFGRRELGLPAAELARAVLYQVGALRAIARAQGGDVRHVKLHGALYHRTARDAEAAEAVLRGLLRFDPTLTVIGPCASPLVEAARIIGLGVWREAFADRAYLPDGRLVPRGEPGSVLRDAEAVARRAVRMATEGVVEAVDGTECRLHPDTLCVHGDTPGAAALAERIRSALLAAGCALR